MTAAGITLGDALAYRRPAGSGLTGWYALPEQQDEPGQTATGEPAAIVSGTEGGEGA